MVDETIQLVVNEWLERQARLAQARQKMRKLGQGLGASSVPGTVADNHDMHLRLESVLRHQQWQEELDRNEFYDQIFA